MGLSVDFFLDNAATLYDIRADHSSVERQALYERNREIRKRHVLSERPDLENFDNRYNHELYIACRSPDSEDVLLDILCDIEDFVNYANFSHKLPGLQSYNKDDLTVNVFITERDWLHGKTTKMRLGRYLRKVGYDEATCNRVANEFKTTLQAYDTAELQFAETEEEICRVYQEGPSSCMGGSKWGENNPMRVYATDDIMLAYCEIGGRIVARALINKADMAYSTIYGNDSLLAKLLNAENYYSGDLCGCRIQKIQTSYGDYLMPYIDGADYVSDMGDYFVIEGGSSDYMCTGTSGTTEDTTHCPECGDSFNPEYDGVWVECAEVSYCCESCAEEAGFVSIDGSWGTEYIPSDEAAYCRTDGSYYHYSDDNLIEIDGDYYLDTDHRIVYSEDQDEYILQDNAVYIASIDSWVDEDREHEFEEEEDVA